MTTTYVLIPKTVMITNEMINRSINNNASELSCCRYPVPANLDPDHYIFEVEAKQFDLTTVYDQYPQLTLIQVRPLVVAKGKELNNG